MYKSREDRFEWVSLTGIEGFDDCSLRIKTSVRLGAIANLDSGKMTSVIDFLEGIIVEWKGFPEALSRAAIENFTNEELVDILPFVQEKIGNPQKRMSADS